MKYALRSEDVAAIAVNDVSLFCNDDAQDQMTLTSRWSPCIHDKSGEMTSDFLDDCIKLMRTETCEVLI